MVGCWLALSFAEQPLRMLVERDLALLERVNQVRSERHLRPLAPSEDLARVAQAHAREMASADYLDHVNRSGQNPLERAQAAGIDGMRLLAENIGSSGVSGDRIEAIVAAWLSSPVHRENLLNPAFNTTGVGFARSAEGALIVVQLYVAFPR